MKAILAVDAGNSRIKWVRRRGDGPWEDHAAVTVQDELQPLAEAAAEVDEAWIINVGGAEQEERIKGALAACPSQRWIQAQAEAGGVRNSYARPERLGADRWCALLGLRALAPQGGTVVLLGTATTIDCLGADGVHRGGLILPGRRAMLAALGSSTPLRIDADLLMRPVAELDDTETALYEGAAAATAGAVLEHVRARGLEQAPIVLAGGDAGAWIEDRLPACRRAPDIIYNGMAAAVN